MTITRPSAARGGAAASWLYGPTIDLLVGAGLLYVVTVPLLVGLELSGRMTSWSIMSATLLSLFISGPHYGATIVRVYDRREDRQQYALFAVWATAALIGLFVVGLHNVLVGSILVTLYFTWVPWHFSGQNYGLSLMFLRRRGIVVEASTKRLLYASFVLSSVLAILALHTAAATAGSDTELFQFLSLGIPVTATRIAIYASALAYLLSIGGAAVLLLRRARPGDLLPVACLALTQSLWFALPAALPMIAHVRLEGLAFAAIWLSAAHSAQYLWVTSFYASQQALAQAGLHERDRVLRRWWARTLVAGSAVTQFPALLFAPALLGTVPWDHGLSILLVSVVNLHHFVLDGAIWKLRDSRVARLLLREVGAASESAMAPAPRVRWGRSVTAALGTVGLAVALFDLWQRDMVINRAGDNVEAIVGALKRLAWVGREPAAAHRTAGKRWAAQGRLDDAIAEYRRSLEIHESLGAWVGLGGVHARRGEWQEASDAYRAALALNPKQEMALSIARELRRVETLASEAPRTARDRAPRAGG